MIIDNKIERVFAGPLTFLGITFLIVSLNFVFTGLWYLAVPVFIIVIFFLFTWSGVVIDTENRRVKPYYLVFGFYKSGKWNSLEKYPGLTLVPMKKVYTLSSQSNRTSKSETNDFRVYLIDQHKRPALALKKCDDAEKAKNSMDEFSIWLKLPVYSVRKN